MAIDPKFVDLINAEIDRGISAKDRALLEEHLAQDPDARALRDELSGLCAELDAVESIPPPAHLKHVILNTVDRGVTHQVRETCVQRGFQDAEQHRGRK